MASKLYDNVYTRHRTLALISQEDIASHNDLSNKHFRHQRSLYCPMASSNTVYISSGQILRIGNATKRIDVELSMGKRFIITIKGELSPDVRFGSTGRQSSIDDFKVGDSVTVHWRNTKKGVIILALIPGPTERIIEFSLMRGHK